MEVLKQFPLAVFLIGTGIAGVIFYFANKNVFKWQAAQIQTYKEISDASLKRVTDDRDDYRARLHEVRNKLQDVLIENESLKQRPDLSSLHALLAEQREWMKESLLSFKRVEQAMSQLPSELKKMSDGFDERQKVMLENLRT